MAYIRVTGLSKSFDLKRRGLKEESALRQRHKAIDNISFEVRVGECVGIVGRNGCGKTTLLKLISGILEPDGGRIEVEGNILPLITLDTGIEEECSGRENLFLKGIIYGLSRREVQEKMPEMIAFSGLKDFIDVPVKMYSNGMKVRLAFAISMQIPHDILLLDEIAAVGDKDFQTKSIAKLKELQLQGKTFIMVSHHMGELIERCNRIIFLDEGKIIADGSPRETVRIYLNDMIQHHLPKLKEEIQKRLRMLEEFNDPHKEGPRREEGRGRNLMTWFRGKKNSSPTRDDIMNELASFVKEFQCIIEGRSDDLIQELEVIKNYISDQDKFKNLDKALRGREDWEAKYRVAEDDLRWMLEEKQFLLTVKIRMGHQPSILAADRNQLQSELNILLENETNNDRDLVRNMHLELLTQQITDGPSAELALPLIKDYSETCSDILKDKGDVRHRKNVLKGFLGILKRKFDEAAKKELWVVEKLLETTSGIFKADVLNPTEGRFLIQYVQICKDALLKFDNRPSARIESLGHMLREAIQLVEREILDISLNVNLNVNLKDTQRQSALEKDKQQLLYALSGLYSPFRATEIPAGKGWGFGDAEIKRVSFISHSGDETETFRTGDPVSVRIRFELKKPLEQGIRLGLTIHHQTGIPLFTPDILITERLAPGVETEMQFTLGALPLTPGNYPVTVAIYNPLLTKPYDHHHQAYILTVLGEGEQRKSGLLDLEHKWTLNPLKDCKVNPEQ